MTARACTYLEAMFIRVRLRGMVPPPQVDPDLWGDALDCLVRGALDREIERLHRGQAMKDAAIEISDSTNWTGEAKFLADRASASYIPRASAALEVTR